MGWIAHLLCAILVWQWPPEGRCASLGTVSGKQRGSGSLLVSNYTLAVNSGPKTEKMRVPVLITSAPGADQKIVYAPVKAYKIQVTDTKKMTTSYKGNHPLDFVECDKTPIELCRAG
jgi:hypothetical protein